ELDDIASDARRAHLYAALLKHPGVGLLGTRRGASVHLERTSGRAMITAGRVEVLEGRNPLERYESTQPIVRGVERLVSQRTTGDITVFGAYDGYEIVSFDDQIGAHGAAGGNQVHPFLIGPSHLQLDDAKIEDARDLHGVLMLRFARASTRLT